MKYRDLLVEYLKTGVKDNNDPESNQKIVVANIFSTVGSLLTLIFGVIACTNSNIYLGIMLLSISFLFFYAHLIIRNNWFYSPYRISANLLTLSLMLLMIYLIYAGGVDGTGPLWIYVVPPVVLFFGGLRKGIRNLFIFIIIISIQLFLKDPLLINVAYSPEFKSRLIFSFMTVSFLFGVYEAARRNSYATVMKISKQFEQQAMHDSLSGLQNRRGMIANIEKEYARSKREQSDMAVIMCDIDHFKIVNDKYGHDKGDEVIKTVAELFSSELRKQDSLARWGGEEYLFLLPVTTGKQALLLAEKLRKKIESTLFESQKGTFQITVSMGIHQFQVTDDIDHAITAADTKLYKAKKAGRNRCVL
ncbi:GGDEF domain-containing protein [Paraglaciecola sp. L3A3]|uniref:GGDEF domain-containing protein n=1 Tax=Paraglaciecola sp. L3A3 TaxID=2686358 RepID=UPI00131E6872|nr:GGDEF domain-containing protein [Paraglaciecola sp. L3A3]